MTSKSTLSALLLTASMISFSPSIDAQSIDGKWCAQSNANDCITVMLAQKTPEVVTAQFTENDQIYADAMGYFRNGWLVLTFRRGNKPDLGFVSFKLRSDGAADAATFNPDGSQRWKGIYHRTQ